MVEESRHLAGGGHIRLGDRNRSRCGELIEPRSIDVAHENGVTRGRERLRDGESDAGSTCGHENPLRHWRGVDVEEERMMPGFGRAEVPVYAAPT
jgi:hypothetical protein